MVRFDAHLDALNFKESILKEFRTINRFEDVFRFCEQRLSGIDDDWLTFALHEGLINNVLTFCDGKGEVNQNYADRIFKIKHLDGVLYDQGEFADDTKKEKGV